MKKAFICLQLTGFSSFRMGGEMSVDEWTVFMEPPKKRWTRKAAHVDRFYPKLYTLPSELHDRLLAYSQHFPNLAKNKASNIHTIGKLIANRVLTSTAFQWRTMGFNLQKNLSLPIRLHCTSSPKGRLYYFAIKNIPIPCRRQRTSP